MAGGQSASCTVTTDPVRISACTHPIYAEKNISRPIFQTAEPQQSIYGLEDHILAMPGLECEPRFTYLWHLRGPIHQPPLALNQMNSNWRGPSDCQESPSLNPIRGRPWCTKTPGCRARNIQFIS